MSLTPQTPKHQCVSSSIRINLLVVILLFPGLTQSSQVLGASLCFVLRRALESRRVYRCLWHGILLVVMF